MSSLKPITLWSHASGPNPWKVAIILEELSIPYNHKFIEMSVLKQEPYVNINPNGRVPAIEDPNTGITLWESGAIIQYLIETYDKSSLISFPSSPEKHFCNQWLAFQISGQGPYFGQAAWFSLFHSESVPSAKERYVKEIERIVGVLDTWLQKNQFLVGGKCTYADLAFIPWAALVPMLGPDILKDGKYAAYQKWLAGLHARPAVKKVLEEKAAAMATAKH